MRKALLIAAVAVVAATGAIVGVIVSGGGGGSAEPASSSSSGTESTGSTGESSGTSSTGTTSTTRPISPLIPTTTAAIPPPPGPRSPRRKSFTVGTVDDSLAQRIPASARVQVNLSRRAGFDAIDISAFWRRGKTAPAPGTLRGIGNAAAAARHDGLHGGAREGDPGHRRRDRRQ